MASQFQAHSNTLVGLSPLATFVPPLGSRLLPHVVVDQSLLVSVGRPAGRPFGSSVSSFATDSSCSWALCSFVTAVLVRLCAIGARKWLGQKRRLSRSHGRTAPRASRRPPAPRALNDAGVRGADARDCLDSPDILLRIARGDKRCGRTPVWLMRQAGRYMKDFRKLSERYPFRVRSETPDIAVELSLQCWRQFGMDAVIFFSDILTPLPALGIEFDIIPGRGPVVHGNLASCLQERLEGPRPIRAITDPAGFLASHNFIRETLQRLRSETQDHCTLCGFVGAPWTLAAYSVEGGSTTDAANFQLWMSERPAIVDGFLERITTSIANYAIFQAQSGAQCIQIFESLARCLSPELWTRFALPYVLRIAREVRAACPGVPLIYFAYGGSEFFREQVEALAGVVDVLAVDQHISMVDATRLADGSGLVLQGNVDPFILRHGDECQVRDAARRTIDAAGGPGCHILNLGHGVMQGTPEENVGFFVDEAHLYTNKAHGA